MKQLSAKKIQNKVFIDKSSKKVSPRLKHRAKFLYKTLQSDDYIGIELHDDRIILTIA